MANRALRVCPGVAVLLLTALAGFSRAEEEGEAPLRIRPSAEVEIARKRAAPPVLVLKSGTMSFVLAQGESGTRRMVVRNGGGQALAWSVTDSPAGVTVQPASGELAYDESCEVVVEIDSSRLPAGRTAGEVVVTAEGAEGSPARIAVTVNVQAPPEPEPEEEAPLEEEPPPTRRRGRRARFRRIAKERPERPVAERGDDARPARSGRFGVRAGTILPASGKDEDYGASAVFGVLYRSGRKLKSRAVFEYGLDFGATETAGRYSSWPMSFRVDSLFGNGRGYLLAGGAGQLEYVEANDTGERYTNGALVLDLGAGARFAGGKADVRFTYEVLLGSANVGGQGMLSVSYCF